MKNFIYFVIGILVGIAGYAGGIRAYTTNKEISYKITVDDIVGTYTDYEPIGYREPNPVGFPDGEWVIVITKLSETKFKIEGSISTTGEIDNGKINVLPTKYKKGLEHININYTLGQGQYGLFMHVECVGEYLSKNKLKLYDKTILLDFRKVADYDYRAR